MIKINNLNKYYNSKSNKFHALKDINLEFPDKGFYFITGKSGSGKSTLLNIIGGIDSYDSGELIIDGLNTKDFSKKDFNAYRNTYIGFIFQEFNVIKNLTVFENIALSLQLQNKDISEYKSQIYETIEKVGLATKENRKMNQLSGGERQRVAIARALIKNPHVIIADEPTGNLDQRNRDIIMNILKELSNEKLIIMVTHDKTLSNKYGDYAITLKDGAIIKQTTINPDTKQEQLVIDSTEFQSNEQIEQDITSSSDLANEILKPVQPSISTSIYLSFKSLKQNLMRFIVITLFFTISLVFATTSINLYFSDATEQYSNFQSEYKNNFISLSKKDTLYDHTVKTGFFEVDIPNYLKLIQKHGKDDFQIYQAIPINQRIHEIDINGEQIYLSNPQDNKFYSNQIQNIIIYDNLNDLTKDFKYETFNLKFITEEINLTCYITDLLAESLVRHNYFGEDLEGRSYTEFFPGKTINIDGCNESIFIAGIIYTDYENFAKKTVDDKYEYFHLNDPNYSASYHDNLPFYSSIFMATSTFVADQDGKEFISSTFMDYVYDDFIYKSFDKTEIISNVKCTMFDNSLPLLKGQAPVKPLEGELEQIVVSKKFFDDYIQLSLDEAFPTFTTSNGEEYEASSLRDPSNGNSEAVFSFYGYRRIMTPFGAKIVGIVDNTEEAVIYFCDNTQNEMYYNYLKSSFSNYDSGTYGGNLIIKISDNQNLNTDLYRDLINQNITIDNISFVKLQVVNEFIDSNLILFLGLFFSLCLFSILMIFNFVVITIKNSRKDIGIYMSLGMNGMKISLIYLFQIILVSAISFIISLIGGFIFLKVLNTSLSNDASEIILNTYKVSIAAIDFNIFKLTSTGLFITLGIAFIAPLLTICIPLFNLSRKRPIDILKIS